MRKNSSELDQSLANYLLSLNEGDQLLSSRELSVLFSVSLGSVSASLNYLEEIGAVTINRRGRLGAFLEQKFIGKLWSVIENGPMVIALTLPSFRKAEGLATAIYWLLNNAGVETYLIFIRGSLNRIKALRNGHCHAVVISALAADELSNDSEEIVLELPPQSFVTGHRLFYRRHRQEPEKPLTVAIDYDSFDIKYLTELEFIDSDANFEPMTFTQIDLHMEESSVDAAVSNVDHQDRLLSNEIDSRPLSPRVQDLVGDRSTSAVMLVESSSQAAKIVLREILNREQVLKIQQQVVDGQLVPRY